MNRRVKTTSMFLGINDFPESPHQVNKKAYFLKLLFEKRLTEPVAVTPRF